MLFSLLFFARLIKKLLHTKNTFSTWDKAGYPERLVKIRARNRLGRSLKNDTK